MNVIQTAATESYSLLKAEGGSQQVSKKNSVVSQYHIVCGHVRFRLSRCRQNMSHNHSNDILSFIFFSVYFMFVGGGGQYLSDHFCFYYSLSNNAYLQGCEKYCPSRFQFLLHICKRITSLKKL